MGEYFCKTCKLFDDDVSGLILSPNWLCSWKCLRSILFLEFEEINPPRIRVTNPLTLARMLVTWMVSGRWKMPDCPFYHSLFIAVLKFLMSSLFEADLIILLFLICRSRRNSITVMGVVFAGMFVIPLIISSLRHTEQCLSLTNL